MQPRQNKMTSYRRVQKKKRATNYCVRSGHSLRSANQLPAQGVKDWRQEFVGFAKWIVKNGFDWRLFYPSQVKTIRFPFVSGFISRLKREISPPPPPNLLRIFLFEISISLSSTGIYRRYRSIPDLFYLTREESGEFECNGTRLPDPFLFPRSVTAYSLFHAVRNLFRLLVSSRLRLSFQLLSLVPSFRFLRANARKRERIPLDRVARFSRATDIIANEITPSCKSYSQRFHVARRVMHFREMDTHPSWRRVDEKEKKRKKEREREKRRAEAEFYRITTRSSIIPFPKDHHYCVTAPYPTSSTLLFFFFFFFIALGIPSCFSMATHLAI